VDGSRPRFRGRAPGNRSGMFAMFWAYLVLAVAAIAVYAAIGVSWS
jgi:hypothetical protein